MTCSRPSQFRAAPSRSFFKLAELFEQLKELEGQVASNEDLKLSDMLRYYMRDSQAAKLLALADYKNANKVLDNARVNTNKVLDKARTSSTPGGVGYREPPTAVLLVLRMPL
ncbi:hypothetical protein E5288_WYG016324 [Bos mutus]|uniref:Uncharacterized protein n=1 Tax=Bos mutus TaxID=72004 RepID=A0A6B0RNL4_9CETA|nr:hypothetical protein [Bos mutus]